MKGEPRTELGIPVKIGYTSNIVGRLGNLQCKSGIRFSIVWSYEFDNGTHAAVLEKLILEHPDIKHRLYDGSKGKIVRKGSSEMLFIDDDSELSSILSIVSDICSSYCLSVHDESKSSDKINDADDLVCEVVE